MILTPDNEYAAVMDACVLAPMPLADTLMRCAEEPALYRILWSDETLNEVRRTLQKFHYSSKQAERRIHKMQGAFPEATIVVPAPMLAAFSKLPDPDDRHVAAAAILGGAQVIVTSNLRDFPAEILDPYNISVQSPDAFLAHQFHLNPDRILEVLDTQASAIGLRRRDVVRRLAVALPGFAALLGDG
jgi:predicted nucleic acid-binding protein